MCANRYLQSKRFINSSVCHHSHYTAIQVNYVYNHKSLNTVGIKQFSRVSTENCIFYGLTGFAYRDATQIDLVVPVDVDFEVAFPYLT